MNSASHRHLLRFTARAAGRGSAFSLIEVMSAVAMLAVIIIGLVAMFGQVRRAFTTSQTQADYLDAGRAAADIIGRDIEQAIPSYFSNAPNFYTDVSLGYTPLIQTLPNGVDKFTNILNEFYFLTRYNRSWNGVGYRVVLADSSRMVGTLYRYYAPNIYIAQTNTASTPATPLTLDLRSQPAIFTNFYAMDPTASTNRIIDGVVDLRIRLFDPNGVQLAYIPPVVTNVPRNTLLATNSLTGDVMYSLFTSNALPATVEVELGVLESRTYQNYLAVTNNAAAAQAFLQNHSAQVHIFRQRIPLRNVDTSAYP